MVGFDTGHAEGANEDCYVLASDFEKLCNQINEHIEHCNDMFERLEKRIDFLVARVEVAEKRLNKIEGG